MAGSTSNTALSLKEYLKRYDSGTEEKKNNKKKKVEKKTISSTMLGAVLIVDEDPVWQKPVQIEKEEKDDLSDEEKPQIDEDIEVKQMKRLEQIRLNRPYHAISEDGSGWVSVSNAPINSDVLRENNDLSPPRQRKARYHSPSQEPTLKTATCVDDGAPDLSPSRKSRKRFHTPSPDASLNKSNSESPNRHDSPDLSPPRKGRKELDVSADLSPPRKGREELDVSVDLSPPRKRRKEVDVSADMSRPQHISQDFQVADLSPPRKSKKDQSSLTNRVRAGLFTGQEIKKELDQQREDELVRFKAMDPSLSGRGAEAVYRKDGRRISKEELLKSQKGEEKPKEKKLEWGKGLAQKREADTRKRELEFEKEKPFARTRDDPELDKMMKDKVRWGDPMAHLVKRKHSEMNLEDFGENEKMKESGFLIPQDIPSHSWLKRGIDAPPNRYGIRPGRHWDGVDRSNGYEKEYYKRMNEKQATEREAYLWSVSDM
ncbi:hypothetical protein Scep_025981 [Stephania cephalantha]|uniref:BUD13 homolog n=1 Tax=Stephania cephalantha TaxID=152367 RepID=A0AAP0HRN5_9MAGN